jgi:RsiW-degrading membrane proteinase PrsW (M82 family)
MLVDSLALLTSLAVSSAFLISVLALIWWLDRYDREPVRLVFLVFGWGAVVAPLLALVVENLSRSMLDGVLTASTASQLLLIGFAPIIEEIAKGIGVVLVVVLSRHFDNPTDGLVYGTAAGLGFAVSENALFGFAGLFRGMEQDGLVALTILRTTFSAGIHAVSSAAFGGLLGFAYLSAPTLRRIAWFASGIVVASVLHGAWNSAHVIFSGGLPLTPMAVAVLNLYVCYALTMVLFLRSEHSILKRQLAEEVELGVLPGWVLKIIPYYRRRVRLGWLGSRHEQAVVSRALTRLAFRKHAIERLPLPERDLAGLEIVMIREQVRKMLEPVENQTAD